MKITAAVVDKVNDPFVLKDDIELAEVSNHGLQVKLIASGICHSDDALRKGDAAFSFPTILGHEGAGIVEKIGSSVTDFEVGDHVILSYWSCGRCDNCLKGDPTKCRRFAVGNLSGTRPDGSDHFTENGKHVSDMFNQSSFSTHTVVDSRNAVKIPKDLDLRKFGPLGCGYVTGSGTIFNNLQPKPGDTIAVFGTGAVGLAAMMAAKISGCINVIAVDIVDSRLELAKKMGATDTVNSKNEDAVEAIKKITGGLGVDFAVDTTGVQKVMEDSIKALTQGGTTALIAVSPHDIQTNPWNDMITDDKNIKGVLMGDSIPQIDIPRLIKFYQAGQFPFDLTEKFFDFSEINEANAASASGETIKPVLIIDKDYKPGD